MKKHEFYSQYANLPLEKRFIFLDFAKHNTLTMLGVYQQIHDLERQLKPLQNRQDELLEIAEKFIPILTSHEV